MTIKILMPALSPTMEEGTLAKWIVKEGDNVQSGDIMAEIETDKATMEFEAVDEGIIGKILIPEGTENVSVNTAIALLLEDGEDVLALENETSQVLNDVSDDRLVTVEKITSEENTDSVSKLKSFDIKSEEIPEGTNFISTTVRDALRDAMAEEMRSNENEIGRAHV